MVQGLPGRPPLAAKREQFGRLIARGIGSAEACRIVGVHQQTGKRWRRGRAMTSSSGARLHYAAVVNTGKQVISERFLSEDDRVGIADLRAAGFGVRGIAAQLGRSPSTVSRELRRNRDPGSGQYRPLGAQRLAARRRARPGRGKLIRDQVVRPNPPCCWRSSSSPNSRSGITGALSSRVMNSARMRACNGVGFTRSLRPRRSASASSR